MFRLVVLPCFDLGLTVPMHTYVELYLHDKYSVINFS